MCDQKYLKNLIVTSVAYQQFRTTSLLRTNIMKARVEGSSINYIFYVSRIFDPPPHTHTKMIMQFMKKNFRTIYFHHSNFPQKNVSDKSIKK